MASFDALLVVVYFMRFRATRE